MGHKRRPPLVMKSRRWRRTSIDPARPDLGARDITQGKFDPLTTDYVAEFEEWRKVRIFPGGLKKYLLLKADKPTPIGLTLIREPITPLGSTRTWYFTIDKGRLLGKIQRWRFPRLSEIPPEEVANPQFIPLGYLKVTESNIEIYERAVAKFRTIWMDKSWDKFGNVVLDTTHRTEHGLLHKSRLEFYIEHKLPGNYIFRIANRYLKAESVLSGNPQYCVGAALSWHFSRCDEFIPRLERFLDKFRELQVPFNQKREELEHEEFKLLLGTPEEEEAFYAKRNAIADKVRLEDESNIS